MTGPVRTNPPAYTLPENFNIRKKKGDDGSTISKNEAISARVNSIFSNNKGKVALFAILTLPLFPITWSIGYALVKHSAKNDVVNALAAKRIELLTGQIGTAIKEVKKSQLHTPINQREATQAVLSDLLSDVTDVSNKYFKESHTFMIINSSFSNHYVDATNKQEWDAYKQEAISISQKITQKRKAIKQISAMSDQQLDNVIYKIILKSNSDDPKKTIGKLSNAKETLKTLTSIEKNESDFLKEVKAAQKKSTFTKMANSIKEYVDQAFVLGLESLNRENIFKIHDQDLNLPVADVVLRDAKVSLPAVFVGNRLYPETPKYVDLCANEDGTVFRDDIKIDLNSILTSNILLPTISLYKSIIKDNPKMNEDNKTMLWTILQLSRTQSYLSSLLAPTFTEMGDFIGRFVTINIDPSNQDSQDTYLQFDYDSKKHILSIMSHRRSYFRDVKTGAPIGHYLYQKVKMTLDLKAEKIDPTYQVLGLDAVPVSEKQTAFDQLTKRSKVLPSQLYQT
jgi:hypothetical protein